MKCVLILTCKKPSYEETRRRQWEESTQYIAERYPVYYLIGDADGLKPKPESDDDEYYHDGYDGPKCCPDEDEDEDEDGIWIPEHRNVHLFRAPCDDMYEDIPMKVWYALWYLHFFYDGVLKLDDNVIMRDIKFLDIFEQESTAHKYISFNGVARLTQDVLSFHHAGKTKLHALSHMPVHLRACQYAGGPAYYISSDAINMLDINQYRYELYEDYALGIAMHDKGIPLHHSVALRTHVLTDLGDPKSDPVEFRGYKNSLVPVGDHVPFFQRVKSSVPTVHPVYIHVHGGLGNQLFQLATAVNYSIKHNRPLRIISGKLNGSHWDGPLRKWKPLLTSSLPGPVRRVKEEGFTYAELPCPDEPVFLDGYFQSPKYFREIIVDLERLLELPQYEPLNPDHVIVHARRGDYLDNPEYHGPLTAEYYKSAFGYLSEKLQWVGRKPVFLLFSDDPSFWYESDMQDVLREYNYVVNEERDPVKTLAFMTTAENFIIANSTFSWWAAALGPAKYVIAPPNWFGPKGPKINHYDLFLPELIPCTTIEGGSGCTIIMNY